MPRSVKDSDDDSESKTVTGRMQTRMLTIQPTVNSPLRRSSRIKQNKCSPGSESDSSISSSQTIRSTKTRTATMDSTVSDTMRKLRTRKYSISSEVSEMDIDIPRTPGKRTTRQSSGASLGTPPRVNTRAASKRFIRAGSETCSPLPAARITRTTRSRSIDLESLSDQNKSQPSSPIKIRKQTSILPSGSQVKEQIELEDRIPYVRLDATIVEADEIASSGNSDSSTDKASHFSQKINKKQNIDKNEVEEDYSHEKIEISTDLSESDETLQLSEKKDKTQAEDMDKITVKNIDNTVDKGRYKFEKTPSSDNGTIEELSTCSSSSPNCQNSAKEDKIKIVETSLSNIEKSLINKCESTELEIMSEKLLDTSIEKQKSNKENQILNIISDVSIEKSMQPKVISSFNKPPASPFTNSLSEKETKSIKKELNLSKRRRSRESIEIAVKHNDLSKETADRSQKNMDVSIESLSSTTTNKTVLLHDSIELVDEVTSRDEIFESTTYNEDATIISESDKIDKKDTVTDNKNSNKIESNEDKTSHLSMSLVKSTRISDSRESLTSILTIDDNNEIKLMLEEQSPRRDENEVSSNTIHSNTDELKDLQISSSVNESFDDAATMMDKQSALTQAKVIDSSTEERREKENLSKHVTELAFESSNTVLETNNSTHDNSIDGVIQDNQSSDVIEASKKSAVDISPEKTDAKDSLLEKIVKQNLKRKSTDVSNNLEGEKESLQMETSQENMEIADDISDVNADLELFQDIPADKWKDKDDVKTGSVQSTSQSVEEMENENEAECDLILMDKQAWLAAETIKAAKEAELFEYDSDDTVLLKSRLDASQANDTEKLVTVDEELMDIDNEENEKRIKKRKSKTKRKRVSEIDQDSSGCTENEDNLVTVDKSLDESKIVLNRTNDRSISRLNKSEQSLKTRRQFSKASNESDEDIEDNANELNRSSLLSKKNISLQKSMKGRTSLNKSSKDTSMQNISVSKSSIDNLEKELDDTDACTGKKLYKNKRSLNKSCNEDIDIDDNTTDFEKKNVLIDDSDKKDESISLKYSIGQESKSVDTKITIHVNDDESDNSDISIAAMDLGSKTYSTIANVGSVDSEDERDIPNYLFAKANSDSDTDDSSSDSDIKKEYNLDGVEPKFSDEDVAADECRTSEVEFSDSDDNGSDLADFIVDDNEVEDDKENDDDEYEDNEKNSEEKDDYEDDEEDENMQNIEEDENMQNIEEDDKIAKENMEDEEEKKLHIDAELINMENENEDEDIQEKDAADKEDANKFTEIEAISSYTSISHKLPKIHKSKNKSIEYISSCRSETETKRDNKMKSNEDMKKKEKTILLNSSNSDLSIKETKKKSLIKENETILSDTSNLISSSLKKKKKLNPQYPLKDKSERNSSEQLSELKSMSAKKLSKSRVLMEFSTPNLNSCKKLELDETFETFERTAENEDIKTNTMITTMQNTSKSKKDLTLNKDISLKKFSDINKEKISKSDFSPDLLKLLEKTNFSKSTSSKIKLCKTMNILDTETPTLKYLRKEKLNESAPTLKSSTEISLLQKKLSMEKDSAQMKIEEKNNDEIHDLISLCNDDIIQNWKRLESLYESMTDKVLSEEVIELNVPKKKKSTKLAQLTIMEDNTRKHADQINEKKKKQVTKENITNKTLSEDVIELNVHKKKKPLKHTQLTIKENNIRKAACQINEKKKKKKKQDTLKNITDKISSEDAIELNVPNKKKLIKLTQSTIVEDYICGDTCQINEKKKKKKKQDTLNENITDKISSEDAIKLNVSKKKKRAQVTQLPIVEDNICKDVCQINKKKKKKKKQDTLKENITDKVLSEDVIKLKIPKKKKRSQLTQLPIVEDNICEDVYQVNERKKKKNKQDDTLKENIIDKVLSEDAVELNVSKKKKPVKLTQSTIVEDNICEDVCQISEKKKKKRKQDTLKENIIDKVLSEDIIDLKISKKKKLSQLTQLPIIEDNICEDMCQINERKKKKKQDTLKENITDKILSEDAVELKILKKKKRVNLNQLDIVQDNACEDACQINEKEKKKKKIKIVEENTNVNEDNMLRKNIRGNKMELEQHKKNKILNSSKLDSRAGKQEKQIKKRIKQQEILESIETLPIEKKKKKNTLPVQIPVSKLKSKKILLPNKLRLKKTALDMSESKNVACSTKELDEAAHVAKVSIPKELKPKKKRDRTEDVENVIHVNVPMKKLKKEIKEVNKFLPSSRGLKRLSDEVIENLADMPTKEKKRQKISQKEKIISSVTTDKSKATTTDRDNLFTLSTSGSTTQFRIVNLQDTKKQSSKGAAAAVSFRQRMLARNNREPISAYMIYREKMSHAK